MVVVRDTGHTCRHGLCVCKGVSDSAPVGGKIRSKSDKKTIKVSRYQYQGISIRALRALIQGIGAESLVGEGDTSDGDLCAHLTEKQPGEAGRENKS